MIDQLLALFLPYAIPAIVSLGSGWLVARVASAALVDYFVDRLKGRLPWFRDTVLILLSIFASAVALMIFCPEDWTQAQAALAGAVLGGASEGVAARARHLVEARFQRELAAERNPTLPGPPLPPGAS